MPTDTTIIDRLRERAAKARRAVAECTDATSAPRPNHEDEDGHESYMPCALCVSAVLSAQLMEDAADALTAAHAERDAAIAKLAECYRLTGADPDGNEDWRLAERAVAEVKRLREESDAELTTALRERDEARAALATMTERERQAHAKRRP